MNGYGMVAVVQALSAGIRFREKSGRESLKAAPCMLKRMTVIDILALP